MKIHCLAVIAVTVAGTFLHIKPVEWCICLLLFGLILSLELVNTALEAVVDLVTKEKKPLAKIAKDTAAGAVLVSAQNSLSLLRKSWSRQYATSSLPEPFVRT